MVGEAVTAVVRLAQTMTLHHHGAHGPVDHEDASFEGFREASRRHGRVFRRRNWSVILPRPNVSAMEAGGGQHERGSGPLLEVGFMPGRSHAIALIYPTDLVGYVHMMKRSPRPPKRICATCWARAGPPGRGHSRVRQASPGRHRPRRVSRTAARAKNRPTTPGGLRRL